jgi:hypothetical protein
MCDDDGEGAKKALDEMRTPIRSSGKLHLHFNKFCDWRKKCWRMFVSYGKGQGVRTLFKTDKLKV